jgi:urea-proton symporter
LIGAITLRSTHLSSALGIALMLGLGLVMFGVAQVVRRSLVRTTHDFIIAHRRISLGFGVGSVISVWTWSMAVMLSSASAFTWGTSGLMWFVVPNGLAVVALVPFAVYMRERMPKGYTLIQFVRERFQNEIATLVIFLGVAFLLLSTVFINLFGVVLVTGVIFGLNKTVVLLLTLAIVMLYSYFGGLWTSTITATFAALLVSTPAAVVVLYVLYKAGGPHAVFSRVHGLGSKEFNLWRGDTAAQFGLSLGLGLIAVTICDQSFWQRIWGMRPQNLARTFVWAGWWFYPIPLCLGLLGLVGLGVGVNVSDLGSFGAGGVGPYVVSHIGIPVVIIALYVLTVVTACYSAMDGAFSAISSLVAVDIIKRIAPSIGEKQLFRLTKLSIPVAGVIGAIVVNSGIDYVSLVNFVFFVDIGFVIPVALAIFWPRYSAQAFIGALVLAEAVGIPIRQDVSALWGIIAVLGTSAIVSVGVSLLSQERFDFRRLAVAQDDELAGSDAVPWRRTISRSDLEPAPETA